MEDQNKIAYCGLFCGACKIFISNQNNTLEQLSDKTIIPIEFLKCNGCRSDETSLYCMNCAMKKCAVKKEIFSCARCNEFPCSVLKAFESDQHPHHKGVIVSLELLNKIGKDKWLNDQENRWTCKNCRTAYDWYNTRCLTCNEEVNGFQS